ncbi:MAG TPA: hypothetical protein VJX73_07595 [Terracidiphilus sp.]|nr:hypothetical protein [Terracidiphilus sp.]
MNRAHATREAWHPQTKQDRDAILRELDAVLASPHFCNSKRYPTLLQYIVENTLAGKLDLLKERTLGVEVFERPPTYDTNTDTVVRYTAGEVRKRLMLYYSEHASTSGIRISLPAGSYVAEFLHGHDGHVDAIDDPDVRAAQLHEHEKEHVPLPGAEADESSLFVPSAVADQAAHGSAAAYAAAGQTAQTRKVIWWVAAAVVLLVAIAAGFLWKFRGASSQTAVEAFWAPVIRDQHTVILCTGSSAFKPDNYSGVITADRTIEYPFVSMQAASAISQISSTLEHSGAATQLVPSATTSLPDLREHSVILLGGYNNDWTLRLLQPLRFHFLPYSPSGEEIIVDQTKPQAHWERDTSQPYSSADDYALVARFRDPTIDGWVVVLAGEGRNGTEAAAQFVASPHYMELLKASIGSGFASRNLEAVLKVSVIEGKTGAPSILAVYSW